MWAFIGGGLLALIGLAPAFGLALDRQARQEAWARIAEVRRKNSERRRDLESLALALDVREAAVNLRERRVELRELQLLQLEEKLRRLEHDRRFEQPERTA